MPTISQLPSVTAVTAADAIPISQAGVTASVSVGTLLAGTQPAIINAQGTLLGRNSLGPGSPEPVVVGTGLILNAGTLSGSATSPFNGITNLPTVTAIATGDLVGISQGGADHAISYANFLNGLTINQAQPAVPAVDTDTFWVAQGSSTMLRQTFAAIWSWITSKLATYKLPVVEITTNTTLDGTVHNGRVLVCSQPVTLTPAPANMGSGFYCDVLNLSAGVVTFASGITASSGTSTLPSGQAAALRVATYSGGAVVFASISGGGSSTAVPTPPGQVGGLTAGSATTGSIALTWSAPGAGGAVSTYAVQYRVTGATPWLNFASGVVATSATVTGLVAATTYDFQVYAVNAGGSGTPSSVVSAATVATPGAASSITWQMTPSGSYSQGSGSIGVNAHVNPADAAVQFGFSASMTQPPSSWTAAAHVNSDFWGAYVSTPASAGIWYAWVEGTDGSCPTVYPTPFTVT